MRDPTPLYDACHASLVRCLYVVAEQCPELPANTPPLHRLRNLVQVLVATTPTQGAPAAPDAVPCAPHAWGQLRAQPPAATGAGGGTG